MLTSRILPKIARNSRSHYAPNWKISPRRIYHTGLLSKPNSNSTTPKSFAALTTAATATIAFGAIAVHQQLDSDQESKWSTKCELRPRSNTKQGSDVVMLGPTAEPSTKILFPRLCNGMTFTGCGVRVKYHFVKVYAVGTYMDPIAMAAIKKESHDVIVKALMDPMYPRTIRIVMNRTLSMEKYLAAICEALEPRMNGKDLDKLEEFKKMNPPGDMVEGAEIQMTIRGNTLLYMNSAGAVSALHSDAFCRAMCDVYYGNDPASPDHKESVIKGIKKL